jgi:cyclophilin family peptidyl-prolyl cis-trans isomerase/protein-disulfide isomerase
LVTAGTQEEPKEERLLMPKKILFIVLMGALLISACAPRTPAPDPAVSDGPILDAEVQEPVVETGRMPCSTVFDYQTTAETDFYQAIADQLPPLTEDDWMHGNPEGQITIVEYADFQCPACANFAMYLNALIDAFPNSLRVVFRHLPLPSIHDKAYITAMAADAAGAQGKFWEMHDFLFQTQREWYQFSEADFVDWVTLQADNFDLDLAQFEQDLMDPDARAALEERTEDWLNLGAQYTPFVVVNGRIFRENKPNLFALVGIYEFGGFEQCPDWVIEPDKTYQAKLNTSAGEIEIDLFADIAPIAVNSFVFLAQNGWYDGVYFHRVLPGFVAQAGDPSGLGVIGPGYTFVNETDPDLSFDRKGLFAMANAGVDTNGSQFFITLAPATTLDGGYTIFGEVSAASLGFLDQIALRDPQTALDFEEATVIYGIEIIEN